MKAALMALVVWLCALSAEAKVHGQWGPYISPELRAWFDSVTTSSGEKCCDDSDGYPVEYEMRPDNYYWVHFRNEWIRVPENVVRRNYGNPTGHGVAWFTEFEGVTTINCFVPTIEF